MSRAEIETIYPLSPVQTGLLYHTLMTADSGAYVQQLHCVLRGELDLAAFRRAWERVVAHYPVLRTMITSRKDGEPLQVVQMRAAIPWRQYDWRELGTEEQAQCLKDYLKQDRACGFDLASAPLARLMLAHTADDTYHFVWSLHHLILDGWSAAKVLKEVFSLHKAFRNGEDLPLSFSRPYRDYILWLQQQDFSESELKWRQALSDFHPSPLLLPDGNSEEDEDTTADDNYGETHIEISAANVAAMKALARQERVTFNVLFQAVWALLLSRYSGENDLVYGLTVSGRPHTLEGVDAMIGFFIDTLPMRVRFSAEESFRSLLKRLYAEQVELHQGEFCPLTQIQKWIQLPHAHPLFETILVFEDYPGHADWQRQDENLEVISYRFYGQTDYPVTVVIEPGETMLLRVMFDRRRFQATTIDTMLEHLRSLLENVVRNPGGRLREFNLMTPEQSHWLLTQWNNTTRPYFREGLIQQLFERQVEIRPERVAVRHDLRELTYRELNQRANQLAHHLISLGLGPEVCVGICALASIDFIVGVLGILKAGAAYVPLDPSHPRERLAWMLEDARITVLLTQEELLDSLPSHLGVALCLDSDWPLISSAGNLDNPPLRGWADNLAYIIYTSGSTGEPKGITTPHRAVLRLVCNSDYVRLDESDVVAQLSNVTFDAVTFEIWGALLQGAKIVVGSKDISLDPQKFATWINANGCTTLFLTTALFNHLAAEAPESFGSLSHLLFGGEAVDPEWVLKVLSTCPPKRLLHVYGPTETTTFATWHQVREIPKGTKTIPIGRPLANTRCYVLDQQMEPTHVGITGELYIGGDGLARGYLNRADVSATHFVPHPFSSTGGERLYRTGDLVRQRADGDIEFVGRRDRQVKLRGFRVELEEVEAEIIRFPEIKEVTLLLREDITGDKRLTAYIVADQDQTQPLVERLRDFLRVKLPEYMIPSDFIFLSALPLNSNGKLDRRALPAPSLSRSDNGREFATPRTELEETIANIWQEVLAVPQVGVNENFFDLGGHSLLLVKVINRLQKVLQRELFITDMFNYPTVASLARYLDGDTENNSSFDAVKDSMKRQRSALSHRQRR